MLKMKRERLSRTHWRALLLQQLGDRGVIKDQKKKNQTPKPRETNEEWSYGMLQRNQIE